MIIHLVLLVTLCSQPQGIVIHFSDKGKGQVASLPYDINTLQSTYKASSKDTAFSIVEISTITGQVCV